MKKILFLVLISIFNIGYANSMTGYKVSLNAISLEETGDYDFWGYKGEVLVYLETESGAYPFTKNFIKIADNEGRVVVDNSYSLFIPSTIIDNGQAKFKIRIFDLDEEFNDELLLMDAKINLSQPIVRVKNKMTKEYVELRLQKTNVNPGKMSLEEFQERSLNIKRLMTKVNLADIYTGSPKENRTAIANGAENFELLYRLKQDILRNKNGENYEDLVLQFNNKILKAAGETITATAWINEDFPAIPNAGNLLIDLR